MDTLKMLKCWGRSERNRLLLATHTNPRAFLLLKQPTLKEKEATTWPTVAAYEPVKPPHTNTRKAKEFFFSLPNTFTAYEGHPLTKNDDNVELANTTHTIITGVRAA